MKVEPIPQAPVANSLTKRSSWIGPISGFVAGALVLLIGRVSGFEYAREASMAVCMSVFVFVGAYYSGELRTRPVRTIAWATGGALGSVLIVRIVR